MSEHYTDRAIDALREDKYDEASVRAQIAIALTLRRLLKVVTTLTEDLKKAGMPRVVYDSAMLEPAASPTGDVPPDPVAADPFAGVCNRCGWEFKHVAHSAEYGSHKFEPSPYKTLGEWRRAARNDNV